MDYNRNGDGTFKFAGTWKLVSFNAQDLNGQTIYPLGKDALGRLNYEQSGRMSVQIMNPKRPRFSSSDPLLASEGEVRAAFGGYLAYYGTYSVNEDEEIMVHRIEASLLPNWVGTEHARKFDYDGKFLVLKGPLLLGGVQLAVSLVWERLTLA